MADLLALAYGMIPTDAGVLWFYDAAISGRANLTGVSLDKSSQANPLQVSTYFGCFCRLDDYEKLKKLVAV